MINPVQRKGLQGRRTRLESFDDDSNSDEAAPAVVASADHDDSKAQPISVLKRNIIGRRRQAGGLSATERRIDSKVKIHSQDGKADRARRRPENSSYSLEEEEEGPQDDIKEEEDQIPLPKKVLGIGSNRRRAIIERQRKFMSERQVGSTTPTGSSISGSLAGSRADTPSLYTPEELERLKSDTSSIPDPLTIEAIKRKRRAKISEGIERQDDGFISLGGEKQPDSDKSSGEEGEDELLRQDANELLQGHDDGLEGPEELADEEMAIGEKAVLTQTERRRREIAKVIEEAENEDMLEEEDLASSSDEDESDWESQQTHSARWGGGGGGGGGGLVPQLMDIRASNGITTSSIVLPAIPTLPELVAGLKVTLSELEGSHEAHMQELRNLGDEKVEVQKRQAQVKKGLEQASLDYERVKRPSLLDVVPDEVQEAKMTPT